MRRAPYPAMYDVRIRTYSLGREQPMIVALRVEVADWARRALRVRLGKTGLATRAEVSREIEGLWQAYIGGAEAQAPLPAPVTEREEYRPVELALFTTGTLRNEVERREAANGRTARRVDK